MLGWISLAALSLHSTVSFLHVEKHSEQEISAFAPLWGPLSKPFTPHSLHFAWLFGSIASFLPCTQACRTVNYLKHFLLPGHMDTETNSQRSCHGQVRWHHSKDQGEAEADTPWEIRLKAKMGHEFTSCRLQHHMPAGSPVIRPRGASCWKPASAYSKSRMKSRDTLSLASSTKMYTLLLSPIQMDVIFRWQDLLGRHHEGWNIFIQRRVIRNHLSNEIELYLKLNWTLFFL